MLIELMSSNFGLSLVYCDVRVCVLLSDVNAAFVELCRPDVIYFFVKEKQCVVCIECPH